MSRRILSFALFEAKTGLTPEQEEFLNKHTHYGTWTYNPATGLVDVKGDFGCSYEKLKNFKGVRFGKVSGSFNCSDNSLTSLAGAPQEVGRDFNCSDNSLTSLAGAPQKVGTFYCRNNQLTSLAGAPQVVGGEFMCSENKLTSLAGAPKEVGWSFSCERNYLTSLEGAPQKVGWYFSCEKNKLTSLAGAPQEVEEDFYCDAFELKKGEWNLTGWLKVLREGSPKAQKLILSILSAENLNKEIQKDPAGMIMKLKKIWNDRNFKDIRSKLVWPKGYGEEADLVGDLDDVGF